MARASEAKTEELKALCGRVKHWRKHRGGGRAIIPDEIWNAAVEVARVEGIHATSKALRFNYNNLKEQLVLADGVAQIPKKKVDRPATFLEMQMALHPSPIREAGGGQTVVELVGTGGARVRIDVTGTGNVDVVSLAKAFWSREP